MPAIAEDRDAYRASFERFAAAHAASDPAWLRERRTAAIARFVEKGLPTPRDEAWRHTPTAPFAGERFEPSDPGARPSADALARLPRDGFRGVRLVFVNGRLAPDLSALEPAQRGVEVASLRELLRARRDRDRRTPRRHVRRLRRPARPRTARRSRPDANTARA